MNQKYPLIVTSAFVVDGDVVSPGKFVLLNYSEAKNVLHRGRARVATQEEIDAWEAANASAPAPEVPADLPPAVKPLADLLAASVPKVKKALADLSADDLAAVRTLEEGGQNRAGVLDAIDAELSSRAATEA